MHIVGPKGLAHRHSKHNIRCLMKLLEPHRSHEPIGHTKTWVDFFRLIRAIPNSSCSASADAGAGDQMYFDVFKDGLQNLSECSDHPVMSWPRPYQSNGSSKLASRPNQVRIHLTNPEDCWLADRWIGIKLRIASPAITSPSFVFPRKIPYVPCKIIRVPAKWETWSTTK